MITLFLSPSCTSCRKARAWLKKHDVPFKEHNIMTSPLSSQELTSILALTENGTDDIISTRSKIFQKLDVDVEDLSISALIRLIEENPSLLRRPLFWITNACKSALMKTKFGPFCHEVIANKSYALPL